VSRPAPVIDSREPVTLVGGAPVPAGDIADALHIAPRLAAADSGADAVRAAGQVPEAVIGDMDSISQAGRAALPDDVVHEIAEQETTDFEKCLIRIRAPLVLALGFTGARLDHALAVFNTLVRHPDLRCVVRAAEEAIFLAPPRLELAITAGTGVSLFPMGAVTARSTGLQWPLDGIAFAPDGAIGTSNRAAGPVALRTDAPRMLVMVPRDCLPAVLAGLEAAPGWPAP